MLTIECLCDSPVRSTQVTLSLGRLALWNIKKTTLRCCFVKYVIVDIHAYILEDQRSLPVIAVGAAAGGVALALIVIAAVFFLRRFKLHGECW